MPWFALACWASITICRERRHNWHAWSIDDPTAVLVRPPRDHATVHAVVHGRTAEGRLIIHQARHPYLRRCAQTVHTRRSVERPVPRTSQSHRMILLSVCTQQNKQKVGRRLFVSWKDWKWPTVSQTCHRLVNLSYPPPLVRYCSLFLMFVGWGRFMLLCCYYYIFNNGWKPPCMRVN